MARSAIIMLCLFVIFAGGWVFIRTGHLNIASIALALLGLLSIAYCRQISDAHHLILKAATWMRGSGERIRPFFFALFGFGFLLISFAIMFLE